MANPRHNTQTTNRRGAMGGGMMNKRPGYKEGTRNKLVGGQKNLPPFLKKKILKSKA